MNQKTARCRIVRGLLTGILLSSTLGNAPAQTSWTNGAGGIYSGFGNWSAGVPDATTEALFDLSSAYTVNVTLDGTAQDITVQAGTVTLSLAAARTLSLLNDGTLTVASGATLNLVGGTGSALAVGGTDGISGTGTLNLGGAAIKVVGSNLTTSKDVNLITATGTAIDTNGLNATWSGNISGATAGLGKIGLGTLTFDGTGTRAIGTFVAGQGSTVQTAGTTTSAEFLVGSGPGSDGTFTLEDGDLVIEGQPPFDGPTATASLRVGDFNGTGVMTQNGGTVTVNPEGALNIGNQGGTGTYNLNDGILTLQGGNNVLGRSTANPSSSGTLNVNGGLLEVKQNSALIIGNNTAGAPLGTGVVNQTGGIVRVANNSNLYISGHDSSNGTYNLKGGTLEIGGSSLHARYNNPTSTYAFNLSGGTIKVLDTNLNTSVNANLVGSGVKNTKWVSKIDTNNLGATWAGNLTADGLHTVDEGGSSLEKTGAGTLKFTGATRKLDTFVVTGGTAQQTTGDTSAVEFMAGSGKTGSVANVGEFLMDGGTLTIKPSLTANNASAVSGSFRVGDFGGVGTFTQTAGTVTVTPNSALNIGNQGGTGTYNLNGGTLNLQGGNNVLGRSSGSNPSSSGTLNVTNGLLDITQSGALIIGNNIAGAALGTGVVNQTGGIVRVANDSDLYISGHSSSNGTYNLNGGALEIGGTSLHARYNNPTSAYAFNLGGGTIRVIGSDLITSVDANVVGTNKKSTLDTNGKNATWSGNFSAAGVHQMGNGGTSFEKVGLGKLTLNGATREFDTFVANGDVTQQTAGDTTAVEFMVGSGAGANATFLMDGGTLTVTPSFDDNGTTVVAGSFRVGDFGGTGTFTQTAGTVSVDGSMNIGNQGGHGLYELKGGTLNLIEDGQSTLGRTDGTTAANGGSTGALNISGSGVLNINDTAKLVLSNWYPNLNQVQGNGILTQSGGTVAVASGAELILTGNGHGIYNLNGGELQIGGSSLKGVYGGESGTYAFNLGGGKIKVVGSDLITSVNANVVGTNVKSTIDTNGKNATWSGNLAAEGEHQMGNGGTELEKIGVGTLLWNGATRELDTFAVRGGTTQQTAGATTAVEFMVGSGTGNTGSYLMDGGSLTINSSLDDDGTTPVAGSFRVGDFGGTGTFTQTAGTVTVNQVGALNIGNQGGTGIYDLIGGILNLQGGINVLGRSTGANAASTGTLNIKGGELNLRQGSSLILGNNNSGAALGTGLVTQTGGTFRVANDSKLFLSGFGNGTYNLNGGALEIGGSTSLYGRYNNPTSTYAFNLGGGTLRVIDSDLVTSVDANVVGTNKKSTIDTNGRNATWSGNLTAEGEHQMGNGGTELEKIGAGTLIWDGATRELDTFAVRGGTTQQTAGATTAVEFMVGSGTGNTGSYLMDGGTLTINSSLDDDGTTPVAGSFRVGDFGGTGTFTQTAGTVTVNQVGALNIGNQGGTGIYDLIDGILNLQGGINVLGRSTGANAASTGTLNIKGGQLNLRQNSSLILGNNTSGAALGTGLVTQTGGTFRVANDSKLFLSGFGNGTYNLNGGALEIGGSTSLYGRYNNPTSTYAFNLGGGTLRVIDSDLVTDVDANVVGTNKKSTIDTNGKNATWSGNLSSAGTHQNGNGGTELEKVGEGTLVWNGATRNLETFAVRGGTTQQTAGATSAVEFMVGSGAGNTGSYLMDGGSLTINSSLDDDNTTLVAGTFRVGDFGGTGTFTQTTGTVTLGSDSGLNIGNRGGKGTYNISAGTLHLSDSLNIIGRNDPRDGNPAAPSPAPDLGSSEGELNISGTALVEIESGGSLILSSNAATTVASVGEGSKGTINQTGGTLSVAAGASLFLGADGSGIYNLDGGELEIGGDSLKGVYGNLGGSYAFNVGGGKIKVTGSDLNTAVNVNLKTATTSIIDTGALNATFTGSITGQGNLQKIGTGDLSVDADSSVGTLILSAGDTTFHSNLTAASVSVEAAANLKLEGTNNTATGDVTVASGSELDGAIAADGETSIAGTHDLGTQSITSTGDYLLEGGGTLKLDLTGSDFNVARLVYANITLADGAALLLSYGGVVTVSDRIFLFDATTELFIGTTVNIQGDGTLAPYILVLGDDGYITVTAVPEPSVVALLLIGAGAFVAMRMRARRA